MKLLVAVAMLLSIAACRPLPSMPDAGDSADESSRSATAHADCEHLRALRCLGATPTPGGHACEEVEAAELDAGIPLPFACRARATSCAALDACGRP